MNTYTSQTIYEIPELNNIITGYVDDLFITDTLKKNYDKVIDSLKNCVIYFVDYYVLGCRTYSQVLTVNDMNTNIEPECCVRCGDFFPYTCDVEHSSTIRQYCLCNHMIPNPFS